MITLNQISMIYGQKLLFDDVNLMLTPGHRYAIVGANGCGKSTLMRLICGIEEMSSGEINLPKQAKIGWLRQDQFIFEDEKIIDVVIRGKPDLWKVLEEKQKLFEQTEWTDKTGYRLAELEQKISDLNGYTAESFAQTLLTGLGIAEIYHHGPVKNVSGGMKLRILLAQALFEDPDILLLDEPTNHLDLMTIAWLEQYLRLSYKGLLLFISHDRDFINQVTTDVLDIDYGEIRLYTNANYERFESEKQLVMEQKIKSRDYLEKKISHMQSFVDRFKAKASKARQAQARIKMIEKIELPDLEQTSRRAPLFSFSAKRPSGKMVLKITELAKSFNTKTLFQKLKMTVNRGEKVAIIGHNGVGKSTLLKIIMNQLNPDQGNFEWGYETHLGYFAQDHHEQLHETSKVLNWLHERVSLPEQQLRQTLGRMLFTNDDVEKNVLNLSGGEAARLLFANMMLLKCNVLILDEPTNHLDLESIDALAVALQKFTGTVIFVSHNRYFVSKIANRVIALTEKGLTDFHGSYDGFIDRYGDDYLSRMWLSQETLKVAKA